MNLKYIVAFGLVITSLLINVSMPSKVIDKINMITVSGYDKAEQNRIKETVVAPTYLEQGTVEDHVYTTSADTVYGNRVKLNSKASEQLLNGKLRVAFYSEELAKQGLKTPIEFLTRDTSIDSNLFLAITKVPAVELINTVKTKKGKGVYFEDLFEHNIIHGNLPDVSLKTFEDSLKGETSDPFLPMFGIEGETAKLESLAFFKDDRLVDTLPITQADVFKMLYENVGDGTYQYKSDDYNISVENMESTRKITAEKKNGSPEMTLDVRMTGVVREYTGEQVMDQKSKIETDIAQDFTEKANRIIKSFQELNIDPLKLEDFFKSKHRSYNQDQFKEDYSDMTIKVKADMRLTGTGTRR
ncbi:germination protein, Ger(x)C family [Lentibacillus persicus]|uniref:Germination protein, Ger(X)C family n=1 Tax=Lentibacillus persicus TaxID=640948 RepID=A0A1I1SH67_9BACI|nr:Ger(x)C family spore germination protein [Lentibacillus persicus]SFD45827.1 germination protein, Ger(x)C family [Lentibacillus persicus]